MLPTFVRGAEAGPAGWWVHCSELCVSSARGCLSPDHLRVCHCCLVWCQLFKHWVLLSRSPLQGAGLVTDWPGWFGALMNAGLFKAWYFGSVLPDWGNILLVAHLAGLRVRIQRQANYFLGPNKYVFPENKFQQHPNVGLSDMCFNMFWHWKSQFSESVWTTCLLLTLAYPQMFLQAYWESALFLLKSGMTACLVSLFPAMEKQGKHQKAFPLGGIKMTFHPQHSVGMLHLPLPDTAWHILPVLITEAKTSTWQIELLLQ